mmetsp:Transcript_45660/g.74457  ORF Transcript_45660/g.74457 Transcript_45660/m.74457 type:complete len:223 (+) Transcript_45660:320-988(+)
MGTPVMMHSETPTMSSCRPCTEASNKWSVVFSNDANISTDSFILEMPNRVIPRISPLKVMISARSMTWRESMAMPCWDMVYWICCMMAPRPASIPSTLFTSMMWLDLVCEALTPIVAITSFSPYPSTSRLYRPPPWSLITARSTLLIPVTMTLGKAFLRVCSEWNINSRLVSTGCIRILSLLIILICLSLMRSLETLRMAARTVFAVRSICRALTAAESMRT